MLNLLNLKNVFNEISLSYFLQNLIINLPGHKTFSAFKFKHPEVYVSFIFCMLILGFFLSLSLEHLQGFSFAFSSKNLEIFFFGFFIVLLAFFSCIFLKAVLQSFYLWNFNFFLKFLVSSYFISLPLFPFLFFFIFFILPSLLFSLLLKLSLGVFLALSSSFLILLVYLFSHEEEQSFSNFYKKSLPIIFFFLFLSSIFYLSLLINFHYFLSVIFLFNIRDLLIFYEEVWSPMILRSSFLWNLLRFFTPAPFFLFGLEEIVLFWPPLGFTKLLNLNPKPAWIMQPVLRNFHHYLPLQMTKQFIEIRPELIKAIFNSSLEGHISFEREYLKFVSNQNLEIVKPFAPRKNSISSDPREFFGFLYLAINFPANEWLIFHSTTLLREENLHVLNFDETAQEDNVNAVLEILHTAKFTKPVVFKLDNETALEKGWFFFLNDNSSKKVFPLTEKFLIDKLDNIASNKQLFIRRGHSLKTAFIPLNNFFAINLVTREVVMFQMKYFYHKDLDFLTSWLVQRFTNQDFTIIYSAKTQKLYCFDRAKSDTLLQTIDTSVLDDAALESISSKMEASETTFHDKLKFQELQVLAVKKAISEGPLLPKKVEISVKTPEEDL